jgi:DNA polymerase
MEYKQQQLDKIARQIIDDDVCPDLKVNATQLVFGDGNPDADVVFIGEAPGKSEDEQGKPFVGAAGQFLDEMISSLGWGRQDIYITNIIKYRPPDNRDPLPYEIETFMPYLLNQVEVIDPKLIATLGRFSMNVFLPDLRIGRAHGQPKRIRLARDAAGGLDRSGGAEPVSQTPPPQVQQPQIFDSLDGEGAESSQESQQKDASGTTEAEKRRVILPLYHPAAALYNGGQRQMLMDDFAKIPRLLELIDGDERSG